MSTLQIIQLESGAFKHVDSIDGEFFLGRFSFKNEFNKAFLVEAYGAKRREYVIDDISVFAFGGSEEVFTNFTDLVNRLVELAYTGIDTNNIPFVFNPSDYDLDEFQNENADPFARISDIPEPNVPFAEKFPLHHIWFSSGGGVSSLGEAGIAENISSVSHNAAVNGFTVIGNNPSVTCRYYSTQAVAGSITNVRNASFNRIFENMGFYFELVVKNDNASTNATDRMLFGLAPTNNLGNVDPTGNASKIIGLVADSSDVNMQILYKDTAGVGTKIPTTWAKANEDAFLIIFHREPNSNDIYYSIKNITLGQEMTGVFTFIQSTTGLTLYTYKGPGTNAVSVGYWLAENKIYTSF